MGVLIGVIGCQEKQSDLETAAVIIGKRSYTLEIARTPAERERGLMFRDSMPEDHGMIFVFEEAGHYSFWMRNTRIPLDLIYLDAEGKITGLYTMQPYDERGIPNTPEAMYVIELNAGQVVRQGLKIEARIILPTKILKPESASDETKK